MLGIADQIGALKPGLQADVSVLDMLEGQFELRDNSGVTVTTPMMLAPAFALKAGRRFEADSPLIPAPVRLAA
jgi:dihydroorotase